MVFYVTWMVMVGWYDLWRVVQEHWPLALTMTFGSFVAGSTPMGGGTVAFPVLVLFFELEPSLGRDFSFAIQSIGMTSATIFIVCRKIPVAWSILRPALLGSLLGTPLGIVFVAPYVSDELIKIVFAVLWASFGVLTLLRLPTLVKQNGFLQGYARIDNAMGFAIGFFGALLIASLTGVGVDMLIYSCLVLVRKTDMKIAIPTSVILMSFTSLVGIATRSLSGEMSPEVFGNWLAAAPVVAIGAPFGSYFVNRIGRVPTMIFVSILCIIQFVWTFAENWQELGWIGLFGGLAGLMIFQGIFYYLAVLGDVLMKDAVTIHDSQSHQVPDL